MNGLRAFRRDAAGNVAAELALLLPLITIMIFGAIEIGYYFYVEHQVVKGVRDGARYGGRQSFAELNCDSGTVPDAIATDIQSVTTTGEIANGTPRVPDWANDDVTVVLSCPETAVTTGIYADEINAPTVVVSTTLTHTPIFSGFPLLPTAYTLDASQQSAVMGI